MYNEIKIFIYVFNNIQLYLLINADQYSALSFNIINFTY